MIFYKNNIAAENTFFSFSSGQIHSKSNFSPLKQVHVLKHSTFEETFAELNYRQTETHSKILA